MLPKPSRCAAELDRQSRVGCCSGGCKQEGHTGVAGRKQSQEERRQAGSAEMRWFKGAERGEVGDEEGGEEGGEGELE